MPELQQPKASSQKQSFEEQPEGETCFSHSGRHVQNLVGKFAQDFSYYIHHPAFLPSFACAVLYLTVLSFAGQMVTYLISAGYDTIQIGIARTVSVAFEILATWVAPWLMGRVGPIRAGIWLVNCQMVSLVVGITLFWTYSDRPLTSASGLVGGSMLSRVGLRGFDLCTQIIAQEVTYTLNPPRLKPQVSF